MSSWMTKSTIYRRHEARREKKLAALKHLEKVPVLSIGNDEHERHRQHHQNVPHSLQDLLHESTIFCRHESRHHGILHAADDSSRGVMATAPHLVTWSDFLTQSTIYQRHLARLQNHVHV